MCKTLRQELNELLYKELWLEAAQQALNKGLRFCLISKRF